MRQIKFRALKDDISNCNFVYGQLVYDAIGVPRIAHVDKSGEGLTFHGCFKETEGQFTGLHDKNGKDIYEGDIVRIGYEESYPSECSIHRVEWGGDYPAFELIPNPIDECNSLQYYAHVRPDGEFIEVIGNVHENPELLKP